MNHARRQINQYKTTSTITQFTVLRVVMEYVDFILMFDLATIPSDIYYYFFFFFIEAKVLLPQA